MKKILILGANGQIAIIVRKRLLQETDAQITLYLRNSQRITDLDPTRETIIEADVNDFATLNQAMANQDLVYVNLGGQFEPMIKNIVQAMKANQVQRMIHVTGLGLYHEVPEPFGSWVENSVGHETMEDTRRAAQIIEHSNLNYTIIRAAYMDNRPEIDYELTTKEAPFKGTIISRESIADLIVKIIQDPTLYEKQSLGIAQPKTNRPVPQF